MTTRALVRTSVWDHGKVRASLRDSVVAVRARIGDTEVRLTPEPLLRADRAGGMLQSIRVDLPERVGSITRATVRTASGTSLPSEVLPGPSGIRVLIPEVESDTEVTLELPELGAGDEVSLTVSPQRHWTIHLIHHSHLDIGYTDPQGTVLNEHLSFLDSCLDLTRATDDWPDESRFRWCVEALWSFDQWARARPAERVDELVRRVHEGRIELTAMPFNLHTETCSTDELHELLRLSREMSARYGVTFNSAMQTDVPGAVVGLPDALAANGVRYLSVAHNWAGRSVPHLVGGEKQPRLFRWRTPGGASVLVWVTDTPHGLAYMEGPMLGFDHSYAMVEDLLPAYLRSLAQHPYPYQGGVFGWALDHAESKREPYPWDILHLRIQGKFGDNAPPRRIMAETVRRWNETWAYPRLRLSRNEDFFADAEARLGSRIQTLEGDWTDWWAEGIGSGARPLSMARDAQALVADAQTIGSLGGVLGAPGAADDSRDSGPIYLNVSLFDEHTWGAADPWTDGDSGTDSGEQQWHWKYGKALTARDDAAALLNRASARLGQRLGRGADARLSLHVVNTCAWERDEAVTAFLPESVIPLDLPVIVRDGRTGEALPFDEHGQVNDKHRDAGRFVTVRVAGLPPLGMVRLDVGTAESGEAGPSDAAETAQPPVDVLENDHLVVRIDLSRACVSSIVDKATGRECVNTDAMFGFNEYIYDQYGSAGGFNHQSSATEANERLTLLGSRAVARYAGVVTRRRTSIVDEIVLESAAPGTRRLRTTLRLLTGVPRLDIENRIAKDATMTKESAYFAFPFALTDPVLRTEATGGATGTDLPVVPGSALHMRAIRRWTTLERDGFAAALATHDAPLVQVGNIALPYAPFPETLEDREPGTVYSWAHNNLWDTNFPSKQGFEMTFRYSVAFGSVARGSSAVALGMRTAAAGGRPPRVIRASDVVDEGPASRSHLSLSDERVRLVGMTTPEDGRVLLRLQSFAEQPLEVTARLGFPVRAAWQTGYLGQRPVELSTSEDAVVLSLPALGTGALLVELAPRG